MNRKKQSLVVVVVVLVILGLVEFGAAVAGPGIAAQAAGPAPGFYVISCLMVTPSGTQPCLANNEIPVGGTELALKAHVENGSGQPAQRGSVIFQDCLLKGNPAPSAACISGRGSWSHIINLPVNTSGDAEVDYGFVSTPRTIGFQFRYLGQGSGIANGESAPMDVTFF